MKRFALILLAVLLVIPSVSMAAVESGTHDMTTLYSGIAAQGVCSPCHLPHGTQGDRLFPSINATVPSGGTVGQLCAVCHYTGGYGLTAAYSDAYVYDAASHGAQMNVTDYPDGDPSGYLAASALPYVVDATPTMECTSCHNVHDNTLRPFLRVDIDAICSNCHNFRHYDSAGTWSQTGAMANWGVANTRDANPGSHPVGDDVLAGFNAATATFDITANAIFSVEKNAVDNEWSLGGHQSDATGSAGGVVCTTCHLVHGAEADTDDTTPPAITDASPYTNFLAIEQGTTTLTYNGTGTIPDRSVASGFVSPYNGFCEACHNGSINATDYTAAEQANAVDPGATGYTHPLDSIVPSNEWVDPADPPANWPFADNTAYATGNLPVAICESCHVAHPAANNNAIVAREDVAIGGSLSDGYILRAAGTVVCNYCHTGAAANGAHHPVGVTYDNTAFLADGGLTNPVDDGGTLSCNTCHGGGDSGAHNWGDRSDVAIATYWVPADNARSTTAAVDAVDPLMSYTCIACHYGIDGDTTNFSPTKHDGTNDAGETEYTNLGSATASGTHFMGNTGAAPAALYTELTPSLDGAAGPNYYVVGTPWDAAVPGANGGWSRFRTDAAYAGNVGLVCESCHELEPSKNNSADEINGHLLLASFKEGQNGNEPGTDGDTDGRDDFCEGCHMPAGTHPLTGDTVDRTSATLAIDIAGKAWLSDPAGNPVTWGGQGSGDMSCDSCHQVHDAEADSANFILDAADADVGVASPLPAGGGNSGDNLTPNHADGDKGGAHDNFCQYCHGY